jgi:hypothetical protein
MNFASGVGVGSDYASLRSAQLGRPLELLCLYQSQSRPTHDPVSFTYTGYVPNSTESCYLQWESLASFRSPSQRPACG